MAIKLMSSGPAARTISVGLWLALVAYGFIVPARVNADPPAVARVNADPPAVARADADPPAAAATTAPSPSPPIPAPAEPPAQNTGLFGDFGGARTALAKSGFTFNGHITSEFAGNVTGGIPIGGSAVQRGTALSTEVGLGFDADLGALTGSGAGVVHALVTTRFGSNLSSIALGNLISVEEIYGDGQTTRFTYLDYEQPFFKKTVSLLVGKINQQDDFIAGSTYWGANLYCFYQNNGICGTPSGIPGNNGITPAGSAGYNYYPSSEWGARLKVSPNKSFYIEAAALQSNPIVNTSDGGTYFGFNGSTGTELPVEVGLTLRNRAGDSIGNVRVGGYYDTSNVESYAARVGPYYSLVSPGTPAVELTLPIEYVRGRSGADIQVDHLLEGSSVAGQPGTAFFAAAEYSDPNTALLSTFVDAGIVRRGTLRNRPNDTIALGFATANYNPRLQQLQLALQDAGYVVPYDGSEKLFELNYGWHAASWLVVRPGLQYVFNPNGSETNTPPGLVVPHSALVFGLGTYISF